MRNVISSLLVVFFLLSVVVLSFADGTTTLTTIVPTNSYTLVIPKDEELKYKHDAIALELLNVTDSLGFDKNKNIVITTTYTPLKCADVPTKIPIGILIAGRTSSSAVKEVVIPSGSTDIFFRGSDLYSGSASPFIFIDSQLCSVTAMLVKAKYYPDEKKALAGSYSATITFTSEVVIAT